MASHYIPSLIQFHAYGQRLIAILPFSTEEDGRILGRSRVLLSENEEWRLMNVDDSTLSFSQSTYGESQPVFNTWVCQVAAQGCVVDPTIQLEYPATTQAAQGMQWPNHTKQCCEMAAQLDSPESLSGVPCDYIIFVSRKWKYCTRSRALVLLPPTAVKSAILWIGTNEAYSVENCQVSVDQQYCVPYTGQEHCSHSSAPRYRLFATKSVRDLS